MLAYSVETSAVPVPGPPPLGPVHRCPGGLEGGPVKVIVHEAWRWISSLSWAENPHLGIVTTGLGVVGWLVVLLGCVSFGRLWWQ